MSEQHSRLLLTTVQNSSFFGDLWNAYAIIIAWRPVWDFISPCVSFAEHGRVPVVLKVLWDSRIAKVPISPHAYLCKTLDRQLLNSCMTAARKYISMDNSKLPVWWRGLCILLATDNWLDYGVVASGFTGLKVVSHGVKMFAQNLLCTNIVGCLCEHILCSLQLWQCNSLTRPSTQSLN